MNAIRIFQNYMKTIGAIVHPKAWHDDLRWVIPTIHGDLEISIHRSDYTTTGKPRKKKGNFVSIYCCFSNVPRAKEYLKQKEGNTFSGKCNYHRSGGNSVVEVWKDNFERFKFDLEKIITCSYFQEHKE